MYVFFLIFVLEEPKSPLFCAKETVLLEFLASLSSEQTHLTFFVAYYLSRWLIKQIAWGVRECLPGTEDVGFSVQINNDNVFL